MLKKEITYTDFNDEKRTETFYFNLSEAEMVEMEAQRKGGFTEWMKEIIKMDDTTVIFAEFKKIFLLSYGEKSDDGKHFMKSDEIRAKFEAHAAYNELFFEMFQNETAVADFITGVLPARVREATAAAIASGQITPPAPPAPPTT